MINALPVTVDDLVDLPRCFAGEFEDQFVRKPTQGHFHSFLTFDSAPSLVPLACHSWIRSAHHADCDATSANSETDDGPGNDPDELISAPPKPGCGVSRNYDKGEDGIIERLRISSEGHGFYPSSYSWKLMCHLET